MSDKNQIALYKINLEHADLHEATSMEERVGIIIDKDTLKQQEKNADFQYTPLTLSTDVDTGTFLVRAYRYERNMPNGWQEFLSSAFVQVPQLRNKNHHFLFFVFDQDSLFCFAGGNAHNAITDFADIAFPLELMKRIVDPEKIKKAKSRGITGELYARDLYFRRYSTIGATESFGQVWKDLSASIKEDVWDDPDMSSILGEDKKINVEVKASFKIRKKVSFEELIKILVKVKEYLALPVSAEVENSFAFLDSVLPVRSFTLQEELKKEIKRKIFDYSSDQSNELDFDFCHTDFEDFFSANAYQLRCRSVYFKQFPDNPSAEEVIEAVLAYMREDKPTALIDFDEFSEELDAYALEAVHDEPFRNTSGVVMSHLHGEIQLRGGTYFLVDKEWYLVKENFLELLKKDFVSFLDNDAFLDRARLGMREWPNAEREDAYNSSYCGNQNYVVGDKVIQDGIEFFDLMFVQEADKVFIVQTKKKFGGKARESCSQIRNAAKLIENAVKSNQHKKLKDLYRKITASTNATYTSRISGLSETQFVEMFTNKKRVYVLALGSGMTPDSLKATRSNIAKFEALTVRDILKTYENAEFKLVLL